MEYKDILKMISEMPEGDPLVLTESQAKLIYLHNTDCQQIKTYQDFIKTAKAGRCKVAGIVLEITA